MAQQQLAALLVFGAIKVAERIAEKISRNEALTEQERAFRDALFEQSHVDLQTEIDAAIERHGGSNGE